MLINLTRLTKGYFNIYTTLWTDIDPTVIKPYGDILELDGHYYISTGNEWAIISNFKPKIMEYNPNTGIFMHMNYWINIPCLYIMTAIFDHKNYRNELITNIQININSLRTHCVVQGYTCIIEDVNRYMPDPFEAEYALERLRNSILNDDCLYLDMINGKLIVRFAH